MNVLSTEDWIKKAIKIHTNKYDYSLVEYIRWDIKVKIICKLHGIFLQTPNAHINKQGCPICGKITQIIKLVL